MGRELLKVQFLMGNGRAFSCALSNNKIDLWKGIFSEKSIFLISLVFDIFMSEWHYVFGEIFLFGIEFGVFDINSNPKLIEKAKLYTKVAAHY